MKKRILYYVSYFDMWNGWNTVQMKNSETAAAYCKKLNESGMNAIVERVEI